MNSSSETSTATRTETRRGSITGAVIGGLFFIALGIALLLQNFGGFNMDKFGPLLLLFPAAGALLKGVSDSLAAGRVTGRASFALIGGLILCMIAATLYFDLNTEIMGPAAIILIGIGVLTKSILR